MKVILDATCGSRAMWFDKNNEKVLFADQRTETIVQCDGRTLVVNPDVTIDLEVRKITPLMGDGYSRRTE